MLVLTISVEIDIIESLDYQFKNYLPSELILDKLRGPCEKTSGKKKF